MQSEVVQRRAEAIELAPNVTTTLFEPFQCFIGSVKCTCSGSSLKRQVRKVLKLMVAAANSLVKPS
jgi:hypothetical protein